MAIQQYDVIIIGAGAAGLMASIEAGKNQRKTLLIEHNKTVGNKILISGGGRCNFTNINAKIDNYISENVNFMRSAFSNYMPNNFIDLVEFHKIEYYEKTLGQLFCKDSSKQIINMLLDEIDYNFVDLWTESSVLDIKYDNGNNTKYTLKINKKGVENVVYSDKVVIACGGLSFPNKGATNFGYKLAEQFGQNIIKLRPGLVPVVLNQDVYNNLTENSGISFDSEVKTTLDSITKSKNRTVKFKEKTLITHKGLSGPAILQISSYLQNTNKDFNRISKFNLKILLDKNITDFLMANRKQNKELKNLLSELVPNRFAHYICQYLKIDKPINQCSNKEIESIINFFENWEIKPSNTEGYVKAEVTLGGVDTRELNQKTMESNLQEGLYFIGEVVDITGWLGGYNFQWAWASGYACGKAL